jgi:hypothetical protein
VVAVSFTQHFLARLRVSPTPLYRLAAEAGIDATLVSKLVRGARPIRPDHAGKLVRLGRQLGLRPEQVFIAPATRRVGRRVKAGDGHAEIAGRTR